MDDVPAHAECSADTTQCLISLITAGLFLAVVHFDKPWKWAQRKTFHLGRKFTAIIMKSMCKLLYIRKIK